MFRKLLGVRGFATAFAAFEGDETSAQDRRAFTCQRELVPPI
jgi:hypothetical protein